MRLAAILLLVLAACEAAPEHGGFGAPPPPEVTSDPSPDQSPTEERPPIRLEVTAPGGLRYEPGALRLPAGEEVELVFRNEDARDHTVVVSELAVAMLAGAGQTVRSVVRIDPANRGTFAFYCSVAGHREGGMEGTLRVTR